MVIKKSEYKALLKRTHDKGVCIFWRLGVNCYRCPLINEDNKQCDLKRVMQNG